MRLKTMMSFRYIRHVSQARPSRTASMILAKVAEAFPRPNNRFVNSKCWPPLVEKVVMALSCRWRGTC